MVSFGFSALGASVVDNMSRRAVDCISATNATYAARHADLTARHSTHSMCGIHVEEDIAKPEHSFPLKIWRRKKNSRARRQIRRKFEFLTKHAISVIEAKSSDTGTSITHAGTPHPL